MTRLEAMEIELTDILRDLQRALGFISDGKWGKAEFLIEDCELGLKIIRENIANDRGRS